MYTKEERQRAVDLYIKHWKRADTAIREMGILAGIEELVQGIQRGRGTKGRPGKAGGTLVSRDCDVSQVRAAAGYFPTHWRSCS